MVGPNGAGVMSGLRPSPRDRTLDAALAAPSSLAGIMAIYAFSGPSAARPTMSLNTLYAASSGFEAARRLERLPPGHRAQRLHGHSFHASVRSPLGAGWAPFPGGEVQQLRDALAQLTARLDHRLLNDVLDEPGDVALARWLQARIELPGGARVGLRSRPDAGVELDANGLAHPWRRYVLHAAHRLPNVPPGHKCGRMHGHGFGVQLHAAGADGELDHDRLDALWAPLHAELDHACLNDVPGLDNPTSEVLSSWLWQRLRPQLPELSGVTVFETVSSGAHYDGRLHRIWKELKLDSALQLRRAPPGSAARRLHGHTYTLRLHLSAPLDVLYGWTVDFGDVKRLFNPIFELLDHRPLHEIADLEDCDTESLARWILERARGELPQLDRVDLFETPGCGAIVGIGDATAVPLG